MKANKIVFIFIIILIMICCIVGILVLNNKKSSNKMVSDNILATNINDSDNKISTNEVDNSAMYFTVKNCVNTYLKYISTNNAEAVYGVLDKEFINDNNINVNNVINELKKVQGNDQSIYINQMRVKNEGEEIQTYYIDGSIIDENSSKYDTQLKIVMDTKNKAFAITPEITEEVF